MTNEALRRRFIQLSTVLDGRNKPIHQSQAHRALSIALLSILISGSVKASEGDHCAMADNWPNACSYLDVNRAAASVNEAQNNRVIVDANSRDEIAGSKDWALGTNGDQIDTSNPNTPLHRSLQRASTNTIVSRELLRLDGVGTTALPYQSRAHHVKVALGRGGIVDSNSAASVFSSHPTSDPQVPKLETPANLSSTFIPFPRFRWTAVPDADQYFVQIAMDSSVTTVVDTDRIGINRYVPRTPLPPGRYAWRVRAIGPTGIPRPWSKVFRFTIVNPGKIYTVADGASIKEVQKTVDLAVARGNAIVRFARNGSYRWTCPNETTYACLDIQLSTHGLIVDGNSSSVVVQTPNAKFVQIKHSNDVLIHDFTVDYDPLPWTAGAITAVDSQNYTFDVMIYAGLPLPSAPHMVNPDLAGNWGVLMDPTIPGRLKVDAYNYIETVDNPRPQVVGLREYRFALEPMHRNRIGTFTVGDTFVRIARIRPLIHAFDTQRLTFSNIVQRAAPGGHFSGAYNDSTAFLDIRTEIVPGRYISGSADCIHVQSSRIGPWIEGVTCEGGLDDSVALYTKPMFISKKDAEDVITIWPANSRNIRVGDSLVFFDPVSGYPVSTRSIRALDGYKLTLDGPVGIVSPGINHKINTTVYDLDRSGDHFVIRNSTFRNSRRFGINLKASHGLVEGNVFLGLSSSAINISNEPNWPIGLAATGVLIRNNEIRECGFDRDYLRKGMAAIAVYTQKIGHVDSDWRGHSNIRIVNNTIVDWQRKAIRVSGAKSVRLWGNRIGNAKYTKFLGSPNQAIYISNVEEIFVGTNRIEDKRHIDELLHESNVD